jgi:hypothetical protein
MVECPGIPEYVVHIRACVELPVFFLFKMLVFVHVKILWEIPDSYMPIQIIIPLFGNPESGRVYAPRGLCE